MPGFGTTHWSLIVCAQDEKALQARAALAELCRVYWYPIYAFVRRQGYDGEHSQDLTQEFFARFLPASWVAYAGLGYSPSSDSTADDAESSADDTDASKLEKRIRKTLGQFAYSIDIHMYSEIAGNLLAACRKECQVPNDERVIAVLDLTGNETGDSCVVFGLAGIYLHNPPHAAHAGTVALSY